ncbi:MAG TPA: virulence factor [Gaiellaceae bacterium]|nr:virulence factor [Gaiellaceae bacterium]
MARVQILRWQEIPSVVKAFAEDGTSVSRQLDPWFQQEIDRQAMAAGLVGSDAYLEQWAWDAAEERPGTVEETLDAVERELEEQFAERRYRKPS